ncbi:MAG: O-antigen ligase family protein [bacterium]|nr:O-antigen ligase family protein [bacterium]
MSGSAVAGRRARLSAALWGATLVTLPWVGADVIVLLTGRDAGGGLQPSWLLMAAAWLVCGPGPGWRALPRPWRVVIGAGVAAVMLSTAGLMFAPAAPSPFEALMKYIKQAIQLTVMASFALWPILHLRGAEAWRRTARCVVAGALLQAGYGLLQQVSYPSPGPLLAGLERIFTSNPAILSGSTALYVGNAFLDVPRLRGTACEPLYLGNYLLLALPMVALTGWRAAWRVAAAASLALLLLLTWSRGAWLGAMGGALVAIWWLAGRTTWHMEERWRRWLIVAGGAVVVGVALAMLAGWEPVLLPARRLAQTFSTHDWSNLTRLYSMQAGWRAFTLSPVVGIGWGQFGWHFPALVDPAGLQAMFTWPVVANFPLLVLCETGLLGFAAMAAGAIGLLRGAAHGRRTQGGGGHPWTAIGAMTVAGVAIAIQTMTFSQYNLPHAWVALGLLAAALLEAREGSAR